MFRRIERPRTMTKNRILAMLTATVLLVGACSSSGSDDAGGITDPTGTDDVAQTDGGSDELAADKVPTNDDAPAGTAKVRLDGEVIELATEDCDPNGLGEGRADILAESADGTWEFFVSSNTVGISNAELSKAWRSTAEAPLPYEVDGSSVTGEGALPPYAGASGEDAAISFEVTC